MRKRTGRLDILVNNAGVNWGAPFENFEWKAWERVLGVNVAGLFTLTRDLMPLLLKSGSEDRPATVVNIGSVMGTVTQSENAYSYAASKGAVHHLTRILAQRIRRPPCHRQRDRARPVQDQNDRLHARQGGGLAAALAGVPMQRLGRPEDLAATILYSGGRGGAYTTGAIVPVDGGVSVYAPAAMLSETMRMDDVATRSRHDRHQTNLMRSRGNARSASRAGSRSISSASTLSPKSPRTGSSSMSIPEAARATPFGGTIAHGFLTLSMLSALAMDALPRRSKVCAMGVNYGFDKLRFVSPVPAGARIRGRFRLESVTPRSPTRISRRATA